MHVKMKKILSLLLFVVFGTSAIAQNTNNLGFGVAPVGGAYLNFSNNESTNSNNYFNLEYTSLFNAHLFYEKQHSGLCSLYEFSYTSAKLAYTQFGGQSIADWTDQISGSLKSYNFMMYAGSTINRNHRLQIPIYFGIGGDYVSLTPYDKFFVDFGLKARMKFYVTNTVSIYIGGDWKGGLSLAKSSDKADKSDILVWMNKLSAEAGLTFSF